MWALAIYTLQGANWQRAGGKGEKPEILTRPSEGNESESESESQGYDLSEIRAELQRRRNAAQARATTD